jgi:aldehyde dehydrogenase (NAD+)
MSASDRGDIMHRFANLVAKHADELAHIESIDGGKPLSFARHGDVYLTEKVYRYYAGWCDKIYGQTIPIHGPYTCYTRQEPVGVCAQIIPWNFPALMQAWKLGPALAAGCTSVVKTAEQTPLSALRIGELLMEAGLPDGVVNIVSGYGPTAGRALAQHKDVDKVAFTGSTEVGYEIMRGSHVHNLKRITLELGGKSANIIMDDADIDLAIAQSQVGLFLNQGQCCIAGSRLFVQEGIYDEFVRRSVEVAQARIVGDPF